MFSRASLQIALIAMPVTLTLSACPQETSPPTGSVTGSSADSLSPLPASFTGDLPCADCPAIRYSLNLFPDQTFYLRRTYVGEGDGLSFDDIGQWELSSDGKKLILTGTANSLHRFAIRSSDVLRMLDHEGKEITSQFNHDLRRTPDFQPFEPHLEMTGMFQYMADAATFVECQTGRRWPVAMEAAFRDLEKAYLAAQRQPGEELMVAFEGRIANRPTMEGQGETPTVIVERHVDIRQGESCGTQSGQVALEGTFWKVTHLEGKPVTSAEGRRNLDLLFTSDQNRVSGFSGCNNFIGGYEVKGNQITLSRLAGTRKACPEGMDTETQFLNALEKTRRWKISGQELHLLDDQGESLAQLEAAGPAKAE
jgi:copper homeostasis protein (lipoprotein)